MSGASEDVAAVPQTTPAPQCRHERLGRAVSRAHVQLFICLPAAGVGTDRFEAATRKWTVRQSLYARSLSLCMPLRT